MRIPGKDGHIAEVGEVSVVFSYPNRFLTDYET